MVIVASRAYLTDEVEPLILFSGVLIGCGVGAGAERPRRGWREVVIAGFAAFGCGLIGLLAIALLERRAILAEFDVRDLSRPDFFVALEAYQIREAKAKTGRPFTGAVARHGYDEETWRVASDRWAAKTEDERESIRRKWRASYTRLHDLASSGCLDALAAPWNIRSYAASAAVAALITYLWSQEQVE